MSKRIKAWWRLNGLAAAGISKSQWDELDAAIREDERGRWSGPVSKQRTIRLLTAATYGEHGEFSGEVFAVASDQTVWTGAWHHVGKDKPYEFRWRELPSLPQPDEANRDVVRVLALREGRGDQ